MERDDLIVNDSYSRSANHDEAHGIVIRKKILKVTVILTVITAVEVFLGGQIPRTNSPGFDLWDSIQLTFIVLTLLKAAYIVLVFMHLGDERRNLKWVILVPYILFIAYLLFIAITESNYIHGILEMFQ